MNARKLFAALGVIAGALCNIAIQAQTISTYAGGGVFVNAPALSVPIPNPESTAAAPDGTVYFSSGNSVYRLNPTTSKVTEVAGSGTRGYSGDAGPATGAQLYSPAGVAVDAAGNLFIADGANQVIRRVDAASGLISTVAGNGTYGYSGDGGPAISAQLYAPTGVAVDSAGNLFIADGGSNVIRRVDAASGLISTVAGNGTTGYSGDGGPATSAQLKTFFGVAVDAAGNLFIADTGNNAIRRVDGASGLISTVAGNGTPGYSGDGGAATLAQLNFPLGVAVDAAGNLFIAEGNNDVIRRVDAASGLISTVAGDGTHGYSGDGAAAAGAQLYNPFGVTVDAAGNLYIADFDNYVIRRVDAASGLISTVAGNGTYSYSGDGGAAASARLNSPMGVTVDAAGNLFIADVSNNAIRRVDAASGLISTVAGNETRGYSGDGGAATNAQLASPYGVAVDAAGNLFIADLGNNAIRRVDAASGLISTVAGTGVDGYSGDGGPATSAQLNAPTGVAVDAAGNLFIADFSGVIRRVDVASGLISTVAGNGTSGYSGDGGPATSAQLSILFGVAVDAAGNLFIADGGNNVIRRVDAASGLISTVAGTGADGYSGDGGAATSARLFSPFGVAVDAAGNLFIADGFNHVIRRVDATSGLISTVAGNGTFGFSGDGGPATSAVLSDPSGVAIDGNARLYISDTYNNRIRRISSIDTSPPIITPSIMGTMGSNGWYTGNVTVSWAVSDPLLPVISQSGCSTSVVSADTGGQLLTCSAVGAGGNASRSVTIQRDATPPTVSIGNPTPGASYQIGSVVNALYTCSDATSGVANCAGTVASGAPLNTTTPGNYSLVVTATDAAGNAGSQTVNYSVAAASNSYTLAPNPVAFGSQALGTLTTIAMTLTNTGAGTLPITSIALAGGSAGQFSESNNCAALLASGGTCSITVGFKPTSTGAKASIVSVTAGTVSQRVGVAGTAVDATYTVAPSALTFGNEADSVPSAPQSVTVTNTGSVVLPISKIAFIGANANQFSQSNNTCPATLAAGATCSLQVSFLPTSSGAKSASLNVSGKGGATAQSVTLSGTGAIPTYTLSPTALAFGSVARNTSSAPMSITLTNTGSLALPIVGITQTGLFTETNTCGSSVAAGATCTVNVTFSPTTKGAKTGSLKVTPSKGAAVLSVALSGTGT